MGKTAACIKIIQILSCRDVISTAELAEILDTNPRNIKEYIKEIEMLGYSIQSFKGKNGGYFLDKREILPACKLSEKEENALIEGTSILQENEGFENYTFYESAMGKIQASVISKKEVTPVTMIDRFPLAMDKELFQKRYSILSDSIESQLKVEIGYLPASNQLKSHVIHPYKLFVYNGSWFILAWSERISDFGYYKLNRIESIQRTKDHFTRLRTYDESEYLDEFGMKQNGEYYSIELVLKDLRTVVQERIYGKNQVIEVIDDHFTRLKCDMQNKNMILSFVLSFGAKCKVISPKWLEDMVKDETLKMFDLYE